MYCLKNIVHARMPNDIVKLYCQLYQFVGRNESMLKTVAKDYDVLVDHTIKEDTYFFANYFGININESRLKQLIVKDTAARNKTEHLIKNIKSAFTRIHTRTDTFALIETEIFDLLTFLYKNVEQPNTLEFAKSDKKRKNTTNLLASTYPTKRQALDELNSTFKEAMKKSDFEPAFLIINYYIDFINLKPFNKHNDTLGLMLLYILYLTYDFKSLHLASLFELLYKGQQTFQKHVKDASHNWNEGLADVMTLHRYMLERLIESYQSLHELLRNYTYDQQTNKSDYIENTINRLDDVFTKEQIREHHPTISDSTINRTLKRLREEKKIRPLGKGRSAKWMKLYKSQSKQSFFEQMKFKV